MSSKQIHEYAGGRIVFAAWLTQVEHETMKLAGVSCFDLPDFPYRNAFEGGQTPAEVAREVLEADGFSFGDEDE